MKAVFGFLLGEELRIYYDGSLNQQAEPLLLEKLKFNRNEPFGKIFVELFLKNNFLNEQYSDYLKEKISKFNESLRI